MTSARHVGKIAPHLVRGQVDFFVDSRREFSVNGTRQMFPKRQLASSTSAAPISRPPTLLCFPRSGLRLLIEPGRGGPAFFPHCPPQRKHPPQFRSPLPFIGPETIKPR